MAAVGRYRMHLTVLAGALADQQTAVPIDAHSVRVGVAYHGAHDSAAVGGEDADAMLQEQGVGFRVCG